MSNRYQYLSEILKELTVADEEMLEKVLRNLKGLPKCVGLEDLLRYLRGGHCLYSARPAELAPLLWRRLLINGGSSALDIRSSWNGVKCRPDCRRPELYVVTVASLQELAGALVLVGGSFSHIGLSQDQRSLVIQWARSIG